MDGCRIENCDKVFLNSQKSKINVKNSEFLNNKSTGNGGAILTNSFEKLYFENCIFRGNKSSESGGAICANSVECKNCTFDKNEASYGGAICAHHLRLYDNTFKNNYSRNDGGAIYSGCGNEREQIVGNTFENNKAKRYGGALRMNTVGHHFRNNTFVNNESTWGNSLLYSYMAEGLTPEQVANSMGNTGL